MSVLSIAEESMENPRKNSRLGVGNNGNLVPGNPGDSSPHSRS